MAEDEELIGSTKIFKKLYNSKRSELVSSRGVHLSLIRQFDTHLDTWATIRFRAIHFKYGTFWCDMI